MLQRFGQFVTVVLVSSALVPSYANAQRGAGAPMSVAVAPHMMAAPIAAAPVHAGPAPAHFAAGAHAPAHLAPSAVAHPVAPHHPAPVKPVSPHSPSRSYPAPSQPGYTNMPFPNNGFNNGFNDGFNDGNFPVPGLGFDYAHFAAVHPGAFHHFHGGGVVPFIGGGIYVPFEYYGESYPAPEQPAEPQAEPEQAQAAPQQDYSAPPNYAPRRERSTSALAPSPEYIFVRRDGSVFFAVAYSFGNGSLQYITQDGLRRVIPVNTLDLDATSQFNEQRGLSFRSPA
jgi:hypothetical protein